MWEHLKGSPPLHTSHPTPHTHTSMGNSHTAQGIQGQMTKPYHHPVDDRVEVKRVKKGTAMVTDNNTNQVPPHAAPMARHDTHKAPQVPGPTQTSTQGYQWPRERSQVIDVDAEANYTPQDMPPKRFVHFSDAEAHTTLPATVARRELSKAHKGNRPQRSKVKGMSSQEAIDWAYRKCPSDRPARPSGSRLAGAPQDNTLKYVAPAGTSMACPYQPPRGAGGKGSGRGRSALPFPPPSQGGKGRRDWDHWRGQ